MNSKFTFLLVFCCGLILRASAQDLPKTEKPIKQRYSLFHPTSKDSLRSFDPDRPNITESPYNVDAGHIQYEADFLRYEYKTTSESKEHTLLYNYFNIKVGLTNSLAAQLLIQTYTHQQTETLDTHEKTSNAGFGDLTVRLKKNFLRNDGNISLAVIPYLTFPTNHYECNLNEHSINNYFDTALQYGVSKSVMFDLGFNLGIEKAADHALFVGIASRI